MFKLSAITVGTLVAWTPAGSGQVVDVWVSNASDCTLYAVRLTDTSTVRVFSRDEIRL